MTTSIKAFEPKKVPDLFKSQTVGDLPDLNILSAEFQPSNPLEVSGATITLKANAEASITAFNSASDKDEDGVIASKGSQNSGISLSPQIDFDPKHAWLKYLVATSGEAGVSLGSGQNSTGFTFGISGKAGLRLSSYRRHDPTEIAGQAITSDLKNFKSILRPKDVVSLGTGEAVALQAFGNLNASVTLSWADTFASTLSILSERLNTSQPLMIDVNAGASLTAKVSVTDTYSLVFTPNGSDQVKLAVFKGHSDQRNVVFKASIGVKLDNPEIMEAALNSLVQGWFKDLKVPEIEAILAKANYKTLAANEKIVVGKLITKLGLDGPLAKLGELREKWVGLKRVVDEAADEIVGDISDKSDDVQAKITAAKNSVLNKLLKNTTVENVDRIVAQFNLENLSEDDNETINTILERLGLDDEFENAKAFLAKWDEFKTLASNAVLKLASDYKGKIEGIEARATEVIEKIRRAILGNDVVSEIDTFLEGAKKKDLVDLTAGELDDLLKKLGVAKTIDELQKLNNKWIRLKGKVSTTITEVANAEAMASFSFEYQRLKTSKSLLEALIGVKRVNGYHNDLVKGKMAPIVGVIRNKTDPDVSLISYLQETSLETTRSWGIGISLGKWGLSGRDNVLFREIERENIEEQKMINMVLSRSYEAKHLKDAFSWTVSLKSDMDRFVKDPTASDAHYGMYLEYTATDRKFGKKDLDRALDWAILWGSQKDGSEKGLNETVSRLQTLLNKKVTTKTCIQLNDDAFRQVLRSFAVKDPGFGRALAAGMYYAPSISSVFTSVSDRIKVYGSLWTAYLQKMESVRPGLWKRVGNHSKWSGIIQGSFNKQRSLRRLGKLEIEFDNSPYLMSGQLYLNPELFKRWRKFTKSMNELLTALENKGSIESVEQAFRDSKVFFSQGLFVRALGFYALHELASQNGGNLPGAECTTTFTYKKDGTPRVLNLGGGSNFNL